MGRLLAVFGNTMLDMNGMTSGSEPDSPPMAGNAARGRRGRSFLSVLLWSFSGAVIAGLIAGFVVYLKEIPSVETRTTRGADGIVVLTGGAQRMADAIELLAQSRGKRLLVSGVNPITTTDELKKQIPDFARLSECCIDLGHEAQNTLGNAVETAGWAKKHGFKSLLIVTSAWHMPRALVELEHETDGIELIPYPVFTERMREQSWWSTPQTVRLLVFEYLKYLAALVRAT
ncbi:MAG: YdcF family protein [Xanthobacteraceae bacterium]|nr:YdcF family protein [Xanthobacteraceae bacterium]